MLVDEGKAKKVGCGDYSTEVDFVAGTKLDPGGLTLNYADYNPDTWQTNTTKLWLIAAMTL